jgi:hypothetical protein
MIRPPDLITLIPLRQIAMQPDECGWRMQDQRRAKLAEGRSAARRTGKGAAEAATQSGILPTAVSM